MTLPMPVSVEELEGPCYAEELRRRIVAYREHRTVEPFSAASLGGEFFCSTYVYDALTACHVRLGCSAEWLNSTMVPVGHDAPLQFLRVAEAFQLLHRHENGGRHARPLLESIVCARRRYGTGTRLTRAVGAIAALLVLDVIVARLVVDEGVVAEIRVIPL